MFGPQARAAELQAVRSAAIRQKSQQTAETIPGPAAVSLTDFARGQLASKNKGSKQYKPFAFDDLLDEADTTSTSSSLCPPDNSRTSESIGGVADPAMAGAEIERLAPTAPKAMVGRTSSRPTPVKTTKAAFSADTYTSSHKLPSSFGWISGPSQAAATFPPTALFGIDHIHPPPFGAHDFIYGLDGYSPVKPELQIEHMRDFRSYHEHFHPQQIRREHSHMAVMPVHGHPDFYHTYSQLHSETSFWPHPQVPDFHARYDSPHHFPRLGRSHTFANDILKHENRLQEGRVETKQVADMPYDRNTKMQNFVAAQQAMAKTGKTVLHNPNLHSPTVFSTAFDIPRSDNRSKNFTPNHPKLCPGDDDAESNPSAEVTLDILARNEQDDSTKPDKNESNFVRTQQSPCSDPFASGYTPQLAKRFAVENVLPSAQDKQIPEDVPVRRRSAQACSAIWRTIRSYRNRNQCESLPCLRPIPNIKARGIEAYEVVADDWMVSQDSKYVGDVQDEKRNSDMKYEEADAQDRSIRSGQIYILNSSWAQLRPVVGNASRKWLFEATEPQSVIQDHLTHLIDNHENDGSSGEHIVGVIGQPPALTTDGLQRDIAKNVANAIATIMSYNETLGQCGGQTEVSEIQTRTPTESIEMDNKNHLVGRNDREVEIHATPSRSTNNLGHGTWSARSRHSGGHVSLW